RLAPMLDLERRINFFLSDVSRGVILYYLGVLKLPSFVFEVVSRVRREIIFDNIIVGVLLEHLHVVEDVVAGSKTLDEPRPQIGPVAENLTLNVELVRTGSG